MQTLGARWRCSRRALQCLQASPQVLWFGPESSSRSTHCRQCAFWEGDNLLAASFCLWSCLYSRCGHQCPRCCHCTIPGALILVTAAWGRSEEKSLTELVCLSVPLVLLTRCGQKPFGKKNRCLYKLCIAFLEQVLFLIMLLIIFKQRSSFSLWNKRQKFAIGIQRRHML